MKQIHTCKICNKRMYNDGWISFCEGKTYYYHSECFANARPYEIKAIEEDD